MCISYTKLMRNHQVWNNENDFLFNITSVLYKKNILRRDIIYYVPTEDVLVVNETITIMSNWRNILMSQCHNAA